MSEGLLRLRLGTRVYWTEKLLVGNFDAGLFLKLSMGSKNYAEMFFVPKQILYSNWRSYSFEEQ
jgi:hypothetical protein